MRVLFVGINPGLYSGATGHHFARPGNRFWPALHGSGFTPRLLRPADKRTLLALGLGVTNLVNRTTATAADLDAAEYVQGRQKLAAKIRRFRPRTVAFLGIGAYAQAFGVKHVTTGRQRERFENAEVWVLPNPSGLNANYRLADLIRQFRALRKATD